MRDMGKLIHLLKPIRVKILTKDNIIFDNQETKIMIDFSSRQFARIRIFEDGIERKLHDLKPGERATINLQNRAEFY
jgi:hypothetical protein